VARLIDIEGIGDTSAEALREAGVGSVAALLSAGGSAKGRAALAKSSGVSEKLILRWVNHADLMRIMGVGGQFAELLEAAGVDSVPELATRRPDSLTAKLGTTNAEKKLTRRVPTETMVSGWVAEAKSMQRAVSH
jgi:predicted flap endonuclease-1-like 5' DNA nuclease